MVSTLLTLNNHVDSCLLVGSKIPLKCSYENNDDCNSNDNRYIKNINEKKNIKKNDFRPSINSPNKKTKIQKNEKKTQNDLRLNNKCKITNFLFHASH